MTEIDDLRKEIEDTTLEMIKLLKKRTEISKKIGDVKKNTGKSIQDETRENNLRDKVISLGKQLELDENISTRFLNFLLTESIKVQTDTTQTHLAIFHKAKELEREGKKIIHLEVGEPDFMPPANVKTALVEAYDKGFIKYGNSQGMQDLCSSLAKYNCARYKIDITKDNILVSPGARFAVYCAITTLLNPGDEVIIIEPAWPAYRQCALNAGVKTKIIQTTLKDNWNPSIQQIKDIINKNTKMIILNYPNNPTGKILPIDIQDDIMDIAKENDLYVLSDEIYAQYSFKKYKSISEYNYKKSIITQSFSKSHAMTGFRIGYAIADKGVIQQMQKLYALCLTSVSEPIQYAAIQALKADVTQNADIIKKRLDIIIKKAKEMNLEFIEPDGAMYLFARTNQDGVEFAHKALQSGLAIAPGVGFGDYKDFVRISASQEIEALNKGMDIFNDVFRSM